MLDVFNFIKEHINRIRRHHENNRSYISLIKNITLPEVISVSITLVALIIN